ncbi:MAG: phosphate acyltransferase PlsX [Pseudomonadales bacterium]|nr:phosphate acyltransferase PlsX [Pseudomonadales bacterium]
MSSGKCIAIDVMGGDFGPSVTIPAVMAILAQYDELRFILAGNEASLLRIQQLDDPRQSERIEYLFTEEYLDNQVNPLHAIRRHRNSSLFLAVDMVRNGRADACVSAGNTGALIMAGRHLLRTLPGIERPAMMATLPNLQAQGSCLLLDVGAHINSSAQDLLTYARMGGIVAQYQLQRKPRLGLLNIGAEVHKGTEVIKTAAQVLSTSADIDYIGYLEPAELFAGKADVVVCDGFAGNITIKTSAGVVRAIEALWLQIAGRNLINRGRALLTASMFKELQQTINPSLFNGASVVGLDGILIKSHGNTDSEGFQAAIRQAVQEIDAGLPGLIGAGFAS